MNADDANYLDVPYLFSVPVTIFDVVAWATLPLVAMFMFFQRQIIESMSASGLKE